LYVGKGKVMRWLIAVKAVIPLMLACSCLFRFFPVFGCTEGPGIFGGIQVLQLPRLVYITSLDQVENMTIFYKDLSLVYVSS